MFQLHQDDKRASILNEDGNILIMGGPGSGKTTIALFKAKSLVEKAVLKSGQKVLFLSFARATISRVEEQAGNLIPKEAKASIEINTYHGFIWNILRKHGYLLTNLPIKLLPPHEAASKFAGMDKSQIPIAARELFEQEGYLHFDLFAKLCNLLLRQSSALRRIVCDMYPIIILDEFQDTNEDEWDLVCTLGENSKLIALADPDQRIYDFRGADPKRISDYITTFNPAVFDFGTENNRSNGTDIAQFGNDLLAGTNKDKTYNDVAIRTYSTLDSKMKHIYLKVKVIEAIRWLRKTGGSEWSLAVLVPTNALMLEVSDVLQREQTFPKTTLPAISHEVAIDSAGPSLAALIVATLLEKGSCRTCNEKDLLEALSSHILGRKGNYSPSQKDVTMTNAVLQYIATGKISGKNRIALVDECKRISEEVNRIAFSGNVILDWKSIVSCLSSSSNSYILQAEKDVKYLRLLQKGSQLYSALDVLWRNGHNYDHATESVSMALTQEHFAMSTKTWRGVNVMTIHKAKGKEFDVVLVYEGKFQGKFIIKEDRIHQAKLNLRVAVTRAKKYAMIFTPEDDPCKLIL